MRKCPRCHSEMKEDCYIKDTAQPISDFVIIEKNENLKKKEHSLKFNNTMLNTSYEAFQFGHVVFLWPKSLHTEHLFFLVGNDSPTPRHLLYVLFPNLLG